MTNFLSRWLHPQRNADETYITKKYYEEIDEAMDKRERPTVGDANKVMCDKGSTVFFDEWQHLKGKRHKFPVDHSLEGTFHAATHMILHAAHTPEQEFMHVPFRSAFNPQNFDEYGHYAAHAVSETMKDDAAAYWVAVSGYFRNPRDLNNIPKPSNREKAVLFAAGVYMRNKLALCKALELTSYDQRSAFAKEYAKPESESADVIPTPARLPYGDRDLINKELPYSLIKISPEEWHGIIAVATGLCAPDATPYPKRLAAVQTAIQEAGLAYEFKQKATANARTEGASHIGIT